MGGVRIISTSHCETSKCRYYVNGACTLAQHYWCSNREVL